jgi:hypothetical protein
VAVSSLPVPLLVIVTVAPFTTSLLGFATVPPIAPVVVDWAHAAAQNAKTSTGVKQNLRNLLITGELLREISIIETLMRTTHRALICLRLPKNLGTAAYEGLTAKKCRTRFLS